MLRKHRASSAFRIRDLAYRVRRRPARRRGAKLLLARGRCGRVLAGEVTQEIEQVAVHDGGLLLLHPVAGERDVLDLERAADERLGANRELLPERDVVLPPDDERRRGDLRPVPDPLAHALARAITMDEAAEPVGPRALRLRAPEDGAVIVDRAAQRAGLARCVAQAPEIFLRERILAHHGPPDGVADEARVAEPEERLRQPRDLEEEYVPATRELPSVRTEVLGEDGGMGAVHDDEATRRLRLLDREVPR